MPTTPRIAAARTASALPWTRADAHWLVDLVRFAGRDRDGQPRLDRLSDRQVTDLGRLIARAEAAGALILH